MCTRSPKQTGQIGRFCERYSIHIQILLFNHVRPNVALLLVIRHCLFAISLAWEISTFGRAKMSAGRAPSLIRTLRDLRSFDTRLRQYEPIRIVSHFIESNYAIYRNEAAFASRYRGISFNAKTSRRHKAFYRNPLLNYTKKTLVENLLRQRYRADTRVGVNSFGEVDTTGRTIDRRT